MERSGTCGIYAANNIVLEEGELHLGLWGLEVLRLYSMTVKPHNLTTVKPHNRKRCSPSSRTGGLVLTYRKFRSLRSLHMRLSIVRPLRGRGWHLYVIHPNCGRTAKCRVSSCKSRHFARQNTAFRNTLIIKRMQRRRQNAAQVTDFKHKSRILFQNET